MRHSIISTQIWLKMKANQQVSTLHSPINAILTDNNRIVPQAHEESGISWAHPSIEPLQNDLSILFPASINPWGNAMSIPFPNQINPWGDAMFIPFPNSINPWGNVMATPFPNQSNINAQESYATS